MDNIAKLVDHAGIMVLDRSKAMKHSEEYKRILVFHNISTIII
jgi:hypothetical protein